MTNSGSKKRVGVQMSVVDDPRLFVRTVRTPTGHKQGKLLLNPEKKLDLTSRGKDARKCRKTERRRPERDLYALAKGGSRPRTYEILLERQKCVCPICRCDFSGVRPPQAHHTRGVELTHENSVLLHRDCHRAVHAMGRVWAELTRTWGRGRRQSYQAQNLNRVLARLVLNYARHARGRAGAHAAKRTARALVRGIRDKINACQRRRRRIRVRRLREDEFPGE